MMSLPWLSVGLQFDSAGSDSGHSCCGERRCRGGRRQLIVPERGLRHGQMYVCADSVVTMGASGDVAIDSVAIALWPCADGRR